MTRLYLNLSTGKFQAKRRAAPRYRSWDIFVTYPDGNSMTVTNPTKKAALADKAYYESEGYTVRGPEGNTRAM